MCVDVYIIQTNKVRQMKVKEIYSVQCERSQGKLMKEA